MWRAGQTPLREWPLAPVAFRPASRNSLRRDGVGGAPFGHSPDYDFIADFGDELARVQVKTSTRMQDGRYVVETCTRGGNQSWSGVTKRLDARRFDSLFVVVGDGRRWCIPARDVDNRRGILIGGPKYERFEVAAGTPIAF